MPSTTHFNPRSSCEERPDTCLSSIKVVKFQSTLRPSPHPSQSRTMSIHAPHARSDVVSEIIFIARPQFQSTLLMRGATQVLAIDDCLVTISIHAPHARSDYRNADVYRRQDISIHAPHARSDFRFPVSRSTTVPFQSTLLMRGATVRLATLFALNQFQSTLLMRGATSVEPLPYI